MVNELKKILEQNGINLNNNQLAKHVNYAKILVEENKKYNLTAITEFDEIFNKHFLDSLC